jgi:hypothetical protein
MRSRYYRIGAAPADVTFTPGQQAVIDSNPDPAGAAAFMRQLIINQRAGVPMVWGPAAAAPAMTMVRTAPPPVLVTAPLPPAPTLGYDPNWCGREVCGPPPPLTVVTTALAPPVVAPAATYTAPDDSPMTCKCGWIPIALAALAGFGATYYAQSDKKKQKRQRNAGRRVLTRAFLRA